MRFQGGFSNTVSRHYCTGIMTKLTEQAADYGCIYQDWNIHPDDITKQYSVEEMLDIIKSEICKEPPVILLHDVNTLPDNLELTEKLLHDLTAEDYRFSGLSKEVRQVHHRINN